MRTFVTALSVVGALAIAPAAGAAPGGNDAGADSAARPEAAVASAADTVRAVADSSAAVPDTLRAASDPHRFSVPLVAASPDSQWNLEADRLQGSNVSDEALVLEEVRIRHGTALLTGRTGRYYRAQELATLAGDVRIVDSTTTITGDFGEYRRRENVAILTGNVRIVDGAVLLTGDRARYDRTAERLVVEGNATATEQGRRIRGRSLIYQRALEVLVAEGDVVAEDDSAGTVITGERLRYDRGTGESLVTGGPKLRIVEDDSTRTQVVADTLRLDTKRRVATAERDVRIVREEVEARSQRAVFLDREGRAVLTGEPRAWDRDGYAEGDTMEILFDGNDVRELRVRGDARVRYRPTEPAKRGERNYANGDQVTLYFAEGSADRIRVDGHAHAEYFPGDADRARGSGMNVSDAERILLFMVKGRADQVFLEGSARGAYRFEPESERGKARPRPRDGAGSGAKEEAPPAVSAAPGDSLRLRLSGARFRDPVPPPLPVSAGEVLIAGAAATEAGDERPAAADSAEAEEPSVGEGAPADTAAASVRFAVADSAEAAPFTELVEYEARKIEIRVPEELIILEEEAVIRHRGMVLEAGRVELDSRREFLTATESPVLRDADKRLDGDRMTYSLRLRKGTVYGGVTEFEDGYYWGDRIRRMDDQALQVAGGHYTTCDQIDRPHFHFASRQMRLYVKDKVVAKPVVFYIEKIPVFALPFYVFSVKKERHSGFLVPEIEFGINQARGRFVRNAGYYWATNDFTDLMFWGDYYENSPRWILYAQGRYKVRYLLSGNLYSAYSQEKENSRRHWELRGAHEQTLGERFKLSARADLVSDSSFRRQQGLSDASIDERIDRILRSDVALRKDWSGASLTAVANRTEDLDAGEVTQLTAPSLTFSLTQRTLGRKADAYGQGGFLPALSSVYYSLSSRLVNSYQRPAGSGTDTDREFRQAMQTGLSVSDTRRYLGVATLSPTFSYTETWFDRDLTGRHPARSGVWRTGAGASTTVYGTFAPNIGPWVGFRHVMQPAVSYSFQPAFPGQTYRDSTGAKRSRFESIGGISAGGGAKSSQINMSLGNRFEAKVRHGEQVRKLTNLADLNLSASYDFLHKQQGRKHGLSDIGADLRLNPHRTFSLYVSTTYDPHRRDIDALSTRSSFSLSGSAPGGGADDGTVPGDEDAGATGGSTSRPGIRSAASAAPLQGWRFGLTHSYSRGSDPGVYSSLLQSSLSFSLTRNWSISYSNRYDLEGREIISQSTSIHRDLHCWEASLTRSISGGGSEYYFRINIKELPDIQYEKRDLR